MSTKDKFIADVRQLAEELSTVQMTQYHYSDESYERDYARTEQCHEIGDRLKGYLAELDREPFGQ